uniref:Integrase catalytic domain-containing protein n=1 Tax=Oedogonium capilliforme TaxID=2831087 RepID=A0A8E8U1S3_9CHLO|nr:hypothetical protein [Oedogonium capilliforme]QWE36191.1 hypothetical protein [Oedogonium capilliforme]
MSNKFRYVAPDLLCSRFNVSQINKVWTIDDVKVFIEPSKQNLRILHIMDLSSRKVLNVLCTTKKDFNTSHIARAVSTLLIKQNVLDFDDEEQRLIIHTDRDDHFTSKTWLDLFHKFPKKIRMSMSPESSPKSNAVSERFNRNVKHMSFYIPQDFKTQVQTKVKQELDLLNDKDQNIRSYKKVVHSFVEYYNQQHIHTTINNTPALEHQIHAVAEPIIGDASVLAVRNNGSSPLEHRVEVERYRQKLHEYCVKYKNIQNTDDPTLDDLVKQVSASLQPQFDELKIMIHKLALLNQTDFERTRERIDFFGKTIEKIDKQTQKTNKIHHTLPLRDPIAYNLYQKIMQFPCYSSNIFELIAFSQFRIVCVLLFVSGARVNEMRTYTYEDFQYILQNGKMQNVQPKMHTTRFSVLGEKSYQQFQLIKDDLTFLFETHQFKFLGSTLQNKNKAMHPISWIRSINRTLNRIKEFYNINLVLKSHSFRIGYVTRHLKVSDLEKTSQLIGHKSLNTTRQYNRYLLNDEESNHGLGGFDIDIN